MRKHLFALTVRSINSTVYVTALSMAEAITVLAKLGKYVTDARDMGEVLEG